jgi:hypothetical protein
MLKRGDVVFTASDALLGRLIRWGQTSKGEAPSETNHALLVLEDSIDVAVAKSVVEVGILHSLAPEHPGSALIIESDKTVRIGFLSMYHENDRFVAYRPTNIPGPALDAIVAVALSKAGEKYGTWELVPQLIDSKLFGGRVIARKLAALTDAPICSRLVASAYGSQGYTFGLPPFAADPDSMLDFCRANADKYVAVQEPFAPIGRPW